jgi:hypothetical protein
MLLMRLAPLVQDQALLLLLAAQPSVGILAH